MVSDEELFQEIRNLLEGADISGLTVKMIRKQLEEKFSTNLQKKKIFIKKTITQIITEPTQAIKREPHHPEFIPSKPQELWDIGHKDTKLTGPSKDTAQMQADKLTIDAVCNSLFSDSDSDKEDTKLTGPSKDTAQMQADKLTIDAVCNSLFSDSDSDKESTKKRVPIREPQSSLLTTPQKVIPGITRIQKAFNGVNYVGKVVSFEHPYYTVVYEDGDAEEMSPQQIRLLISHQNIDLGVTEVIKPFPDGVNYKGKVVSFEDPYYNVVFEDGDSEEMLLDALLEYIIPPKAENIIFNHFKIMNPAQEKASALRGTSAELNQECVIVTDGSEMKTNKASKNIPLHEPLSELQQAVEEQSTKKTRKLPSSFDQPVFKKKKECAVCEHFFEHSGVDGNKQQCLLCADYLGHNCNAISKKEIEHANANISTREEKSKNLAKLVASLEEALSFSRQEYAATVEEAKKIQQANAETQQRDKQIEKLTSEVAQMQNKFVSLQEEVQQKSGALEKLKKQLVSLQEEVQQKSGALDTLKKQAYSETQQRDKQIEKLTNEKTQVQKQLITLQDESLRKTGEVEKLKNQVNSYQNEDVLAGIQRLIGQADIRQMKIELLIALQGILETSATIVKERKDCLFAEERARKEEEILCCVCLANPKCIMLLPCQHVCVCEGCQLQITKCPLDQIKIEQKIKAFF